MLKTDVSTEKNQDIDMKKLELPDIGKEIIKTKESDKIYNLRLNTVKVEESERNDTARSIQKKPESLVHEVLSEYQEESTKFEQSTFRPDTSKRLLLRQPSGLILEDFSSKVLKINQVPKNASQTCSGQKLIKPIVDPVLYQSQKTITNGFSEETIEYFKLSNTDL